jgi:hypothetical protein
MNYDALKETVINNVCKVIRSNLDNTSFIQTLFNAFTAENEKIKNDIQNRNELLLQTFMDLAQVFGVEFEEGYSIPELEKNIIEFKNKIESLASTQRPKQRYLCFSGSDEYGNSYCTCVTEKDIAYVELALIDSGSDSFEHLYQEDSKLLIDMCIRNETTVDILLGMGSGALLDVIDKFFVKIIKADSVSLGQFSEYIACLISGNRHSGTSSIWVTL